MTNKLPIKNERLLKSIRREPVDMTPIWIMRQAGRYLPEYRATRERAGSFMRLCKTPELACEVTLQPLVRYPLDAAIIFSDILTIPDAMGLGLEMIEGKGPMFSRPLHRVEDIYRLEVPDLANLEYVYQAIRLVQHELSAKVPLIGFCGSPWTLAAYMVQGESQPSFPRLQQLKAEDPKALHHLLATLADAVAAHLNGQIAAGADVVMVFDTWGGMLSEDDYDDYSLSYVKRVFAGLESNYNKRRVPVILFTKGGGRFLPQMQTAGCDMVGLDWEVSLAQARKLLGEQMALQGNLNPAILLQSPEVIRQEVQRVLDSYGQGPGHVFNLGHGITPDVPPEHVAVLIEAVHELSKPYHSVG